MIRIQKSELLGEAIKASFIQPPEISSLLEVPYPLSMKHSAGSVAGLVGGGGAADSSTHFTKGTPQHSLQTEL